MGAGPDAEDVVQEAFVKAYGSLDRFRAGAAFRPWLLQIVANETKNLHRGEGRRTARERRAWLHVQPLLRLPANDDPSTTVLARDRAAELAEAMSALSEPHRQVVTCRFLLDLDESETATVLGWPRGTVKSRLHRALRKLHSELETPSSRRGEGRRATEVRHGA